MNEVLLQQVRSEVESLVGQSTTDMEPQALYSFICRRIEDESAERTKAHGGHCTLTLNGLLVAESTMRTKVFSVPPQTVNAA